MPSRLNLWAVIGLSCALTACAGHRPFVEPPPTTTEEAKTYEALYPYYAETCALSQIKKKPGFGVELSGGIGGHNVLYLNNVCQIPDERYPTLAMCDELPLKPAHTGVGITVNSHFRNAMWAAVEGRDFLFNGELPSDTPLTREAYARAQNTAKDRGLYEAITFHDEFFKEMPPGFTRESFRYEISIATDYAVAFGRNRYCARVPLSRKQMTRVFQYLNGLNAPYRTGHKVFDWNILTHNCAHVNHNALAATNLWFKWPMDRFIVISALDFPVPKNEFVNLMERTNNLPIADPTALFRDEYARRMLLEDGRLPTMPGAIADLGKVTQPNELYDTDSEIIFYDEPITGSYERRFRALLTQPRYFRLRDNLAYFASEYEKILEQELPLGVYLARHPVIAEEELPAFRNFYARYYAYIRQQAQEVRTNLVRIESTQQ